MKKILFKDRDIVVPGEIIASGMDVLPAGCAFRENENIVASQIGLINISENIVKVIPLTGVYLPKKGDTIIGTIEDMTSNVWFVDIGGPYNGILAIRDVPEFVDKNDELSKYYDYGEVIAAKVNKMVKNKSIELTMKQPGLTKLKEGILITITPSKVPRVIGKQGSMVDLIKKMTNTKITIGQNGIVWIKGNSAQDEALAIKAIKKVEAESHLEGLTDRIKEFLEKEN